MNSKILLITLLFLGLFSKAQGQGRAQDLNQLSIGDKVPDGVMRIIPKGKQTRLIILDQWSTTCSSCVAAFPKMEALQRTFKGDLQVVLITTESEAEINARPVVKKRLPQLPSITGDSVFKSLFPYVLVPQHVWINHQGIVVAITDGANATEENIKHYLSSEDISLSQKQDLIDFDYDKPLFSGLSLPLLQMQAYSIYLKGRVGLKSGNTFRRTDGVIHGRSITNTSAITLYKMTARELIPGFTEKRFLIDTATSLNRNVDFNRAYRTDNDLCSYDLIVPVDQASKLYTYMLEDLNRYSGYKGSIEKRSMTCLVLVRTSNLDKIRANANEKQLNTLFTGQQQVLKNGPLSYMLNRLHDQKYIQWPVIDETNYKHNVHLEFFNKIQSLEAFKKELSRYDLDVIETVRLIDVFVLSESNR